MPLMEPYRIKVVEPIPITSREQRIRALERAGYNAFNLRSDEVTIDLLSDSGTGATSQAQEAAAALADEAYASSRSWYRFHAVVSELTGYPHILPVHQGRGAERVLFSTVLNPDLNPEKFRSGEKPLVLSNTHFDTTSANVVLAGAVPIDLPCPESRDLDSPYPFKGNIDLSRLEEYLVNEGHRVAFVLMTVTNNGLGGQPVSMANLAAAAELCRDHRVPFFLDAARFAENAWLVIQREPEWAGASPAEVVRAAFELSDGCVASLKKDGISAEGAFIGLRDDRLFAYCEANLIATEGFSTYGGLAGHELDRLAQGMREVVDPYYLAARADAAAHLARLANDAGVATVQPPGIHGIYLNAGRLLPHLRPRDFPGHALACQLFVDGGIRCHEVGSLYLGTLDENNVVIEPAPYELVRLALPRRVYTQSHLEYVAEVLAEIAKDPTRVPAYRITHAPPLLRHFKLRVEPVPPGQST